MLKKDFWDALNYNDGMLAPNQLLMKEAQKLRKELYQPQSPLKNLAGRKLQECEESKVEEDTEIISQKQLNDENEAIILKQQ